MATYINFDRAAVCLRRYSENLGRRDDWFQLSDFDNFDAFRAHLDTIPAADWSVVDYEFLPGAFSGSVAALRGFFDLRDELDGEENQLDAFAAFCDARLTDSELLDDPAACVQEFRDKYMGDADSLGDYVEDHFDEFFQDCPEHLRPYIDCGIMARDLDCEGWTEWDGHIFAN